MLAPRLDRDPCHPKVFVVLDQLQKLFFELLLNTEVSMKSLTFKQLFEVTFDLICRKEGETQEAPNPYVKFWLVE